MVFLTKILRFAKETKAQRKYMRTTFLDSLRLHVKGGTGGNGLPKYGGIGGQGGDIFVVASEEESLDGVIRKWPKKRIAAGHGTNSHQKFILGPPGTSVKIEVPVGITVLMENGKVVGELNEPGTELLVAHGGIGGSPKNGYIGMKGQSHVVILDLKLIADIGLVGFPNAGKSTLLSAISKAKPKIASYPFTTIRPNIGVIEYEDFRQITMADLPGLIEGAHANIGMGHKFLKHVERTKILLLVVDINGFQLSPKHAHRSCLDTIVLLNKELELYKEDLLNKPTIVAINKMDTQGSNKKYDLIKDQIKNLGEVLQNYPDEIRPNQPIVFTEIIPISAKENGHSVNFLKDKLRLLLDIFADMENEKSLENNAKFVKETTEELKERGPKLV